MTAPELPDHNVSFTASLEVGKPFLVVADVRAFLEGVPNHASFTTSHNGYSAILEARWDTHKTEPSEPEF